MMEAIILAIVVVVAFVARGLKPAVAAAGDAPPATPVVGPRNEVIAAFNQAVVPGGAGAPTLADTYGAQGYSGGASPYRPDSYSSGADSPAGSTALSTSSPGAYKLTEPFGELQR